MGFHMSSMSSGQFLLRCLLACGFPAPAAADCGFSAWPYLQLIASFLSPSLPASPSLCLPHTLHSSPCTLIFFLSISPPFFSALLLCVHPSLLSPLMQLDAKVVQEGKRELYVSASYNLALPRKAKWDKSAHFGRLDRLCIAQLQQKHRATEPSYSMCIVFLDTKSSDFWV